jgi:hypothetical protein
VAQAAIPECLGTGEVLGQFRAELKEFEPTLEEKERLFDAKLAALEERLMPVDDLQRVVALVALRAFLALRTSNGLTAAALLAALAQRLPAFAGA